MEPKIKDFIDRINRLEARYKGDPIAKYADSWLIPKDVLMAVRDHLKPPAKETAELPLFELTETI